MCPLADTRRLESRRERELERGREREGLFCGETFFTW